MQNYNVVFQLKLHINHLNPSPQQNRCLNLCIFILLSVFNKVNMSLILTTVITVSYHRICLMLRVFLNRERCFKLSTCFHALLNGTFCSFYILLKNTAKSLMANFCQVYSPWMISWGVRCHAVYRSGRTWS